MIIETERLILRPIEEKDDKDIFEYSKVRTVGKNAGWKPHESIEETREIMKELFLGKKGIFGIVVKETNRLVGTIGLIADPARNNDGAKMLGYALAENCWGHGYMTEAAKAVIHYGFTILEADIITINCYTHNTRSERVIRNCDFQYEGTLRECQNDFEGEVHDCAFYSMTAGEYEAKAEEIKF